nr:hypothetical protein GCM10025699_51770 [Microbacterium flavescens]
MHDLETATIDTCRGGAGRVGDAPCAGAVAGSAPVLLCDRHLALVADWLAGREEHPDGLTDLLPTPCPACGSRLGVRWPSGWLCAVCEWRLGDVPDADLAPPRVDVVYYIRFDDRIKIGTTANPGSGSDGSGITSCWPSSGATAASRGGGTSSSAPGGSGAPSGSLRAPSSTPTRRPSPPASTTRGSGTRAGAARPWPSAPERGPADPARQSRR